MTQLLTASILLLAMVGSVLAGAPPHSGEQHCPMNMEDCCETAHSPKDAPEVSAARLCCALNCNEPGTTAPASTFKIQPSVANALHQAIVPPAPAAPNSVLFRSRSTASRGQGRPPAYIRHLALLI